MNHFRTSSLDSTLNHELQSFDNEDYEHNSVFLSKKSFFKKLTSWIKTFKFNNTSSNFRDFRILQDTTRNNENNENNETSHSNDLTVIDWNYENTKERKRKRKLKIQKENQNQNETNIQNKYFPNLNITLDSICVWVVLLFTGCSLGIIAAIIDVCTSFFGDLKSGYCKGSFYLNRSFCCLGLNFNDTCEDWITWDKALHANNSLIGSYIVNYLFYIIFCIVYTFCTVLLVIHYSNYAKGSGIAEVKSIVSGFVIKNFINPFTLLIKSIGLILAVSAGLWVGQEGPLVHVASCCAEFFMQFYKPLYENEVRKRNLLVASSAAGISVAFGSPIGGVLFTLEKISYYSPSKTIWISFVCAMISSVVLQFMSPFRSNSIVLFQASFTNKVFHRFEILPFIILGVYGGLFGSLYIYLNRKFYFLRKKLSINKHPIKEALSLALITAILNYPVIFMRAEINVLVSRLFVECSAQDQNSILCNKDSRIITIFLLFLTTTLGTLLSAYSIGINIPAGIIMPSLALGASFGRLLGIIIQAWNDKYPNAWIFSDCPADGGCISPSAYALVGAAAALGGVTRMTFSIVVIMFEVTGALSYVLPIMIAVMISKWVGDAFGKEGIYESIIEYKEYTVLDNSGSRVPDVIISDFMTPIEDLIVLKENGLFIKDLRKILENYNYNGFPIIKNSGDAILIGYITRKNLLIALDQIKENAQFSENTICVFKKKENHDEYNNIHELNFYDWIDSAPFILSQQSSLLLVTTFMQKIGSSHILLTSKGSLKGMVTKRDVWRIIKSKGKVNTDSNISSNYLFYDSEQI